ncbi:MAG: CocE/NonD family hydrolase C-terminal non-catalytic domain-containing protein, partial [Gemmatimonadales bacterium]|nr:CocE/NonD family hydrolase C-terminal non-catalytic domain-containing protein [Gemmatimonadales bacterium]
YHRSHREDVAPLGAEPVELAFDLMATSKMFRQGHRIRLSIRGADQGNFGALASPEPPRLVIHRSATQPSRLVLPIVR